MTDVTNEEADNVAREKLEAEYAIAAHARYAASLNAWFSTKLESDKSILVMSTAGVGFLITQTASIKSIEGFILYTLSVFCFLICIICTIIVFDKNASVIEEMLQGKQGETDKQIRIFDRLSRICFFVGLLFSSIIGISWALNSLLNR